MSTSPLDELAFLTAALKAHAEWVQVCGGSGLPPSDETWLEARREHYRRTVYTGPNQEVTNAAVTPSPTVAPTPADVETPVSAPATPPRVTPPAAPPAPAPATHAVSHPTAAMGEVAALVKRVAVVSGVVPDADVPSAERQVLPAVSELSPEERRTRLTMLDREVRQCRACTLCEERTNTVFARGDGTVGVAFVGEGPGADEDAQGVPFVGVAGQLLDKMIAAMGLNRESVYVCNIVKCRPPKNRKPTEEEMAACRHFVVSQLDLVQPRVIVAMGATAVEGLLGVKLSITRMRGTWRLYKGTIPVMPTFHPAYLLRQPDAKRQVWEDLQAVLTRLNMPLPQRRK